MSKNAVSSLSHRIRRFLRPAAGLLAAALLALAPAGLHAQQGVTSGSVAGVVRDADGTPLADVAVTVTSISRGTTERALTDQNGRYVVGLLQPGRYTVKAELPPRPTAQEGPVQVTLGERTTVNLTLQPISAEEIAVSVGGPTSIDVTQSGVVDQVSEQQISELPTSGRDFTDFINLSGLVSPQPGVGTGGQFSIGGARTSGTNIQIDGADANNTFFGENRGSSRMPFTFSLESIKEFQLVTNGYDVEYGKFSGGVVNAVTKTGTNEFHGDAFLFFRDKSLTVDNFNGSPPADFQSFQFGGSLSGPIVKDRAHFFLSGDVQRQNQPVFALTPDRSGFTQAGIDQFRNILVNTYGFDPAEVDSNIGQFTASDNEVNLFGRVDWKLSDDHRLTVRANYANFDSPNDRISPSGNEAKTVGGNFQDNNVSAVAELNSTLGRDVYNTFRFQFSWEDRPRPGNSYLPSIEVSGIPTQGTGTGSITYGGSFFGILFRNDLKERKLQFTDNLTWHLGDHTLKVGTDDILTHTENLFWLNGNGFFTFNSLQDFQDQNPGFFLRFVPSLTNPQAPFAEFNTGEWSGYVQDAWQATPNLLLTLGLRYDYTNFDNPGTGLADPNFRSIVRDEFGQSTTNKPRDTNNWGPRASFTYDVTGDQRHVIRGGVGLFYGRVPTVLNGNVLSKTPNPLLSVTCIAAATPDISDYRNMTSPDAIPSQCAFEGFQGSPFGLGIVGAPQITVWDKNMEQPETWKANLGYEQRIGERWKAGIEGIFSNTVSNFTVQDLNLRGPVFTTADGRPVHVSQTDFADLMSGQDAANNEQRGANTSIDRLFYETKSGKFRAWNVKLDINGAPTDWLRVAANYTLNLAYDNSSFFCCTESEGFSGTPTAGNPNYLGSYGDRFAGTWGPSDFQRRHVFVMNARFNLPTHTRIGLIYRAQSGNPFTPSVFGDINGDGEDGNDRPYLPDPANPQGMEFATPADRQAYQQVLADNKCLRDHVGQIVPRNTCTNPWFHRVDLEIAQAIPTVGSQHAEVVLDLFNVLDGLGRAGILNDGAGDFVFEQNQLFTEVGYDQNTNRVIYTTRSDFGRKIPVGFEPFQFQAQLGVRYRF